MAKKGCPQLVTDKLKKLPADPGCYIYKDEKGQVLYVGKALSLRSRVRSYFQESARHTPRIARLVSKVCDIEWMVVQTEVEALVLECNLIKQHRPPYNVRMRDDKSYPYITITNEPFPRVLFTRKVRRDGSKYFGPYTSAFAVRDTLQLLHKIFPLIPCGKSWSGDPVQRTCLYFHLGRCLGPCAGLSDRAAYGVVLDRVERFLSGKEESIVDDLKREMNQAAVELDFEKAAKYRDQIQAIETVMQRQQAVLGEKVDQDVIAVVKDERGAAIQMLYIRGGKLIGQRQYVLDGAADAAPSEAVQEFVKQYYADAPDVPREILLPVEIEERNIVQSWLRQRRGAAVTVEVPQTGEKARLVDLAAANAEQALNTFSQELQRKEAWAEDAMGQLQDEIGLPEPPVRIEGYDISNIQGTAPVGSMVVTENGEAAKAEYRRFKIRYHPESPNDFAMMHEVITRRLKAYIDKDEKFSKMPDLIMIDGGKGQLAAALKARDELGLTVPMVGLAKRHELIYVPIDVPEDSRQAAKIAKDLEPSYPPTDLPTYPQDSRQAAKNANDPGPSYPPTNLPTYLENSRQAAKNATDPGPSGQPTNLPTYPEDSRQAAKIATDPGPSGPPTHLPTYPEDAKPAEDPAPTYPPTHLPTYPEDPQPPGPTNPSTHTLEAEYSYRRKASREYDYREIELPLNSPGLLLLRKLRDEAHRFALTYHRKIRDKRLNGSAIEEIPGIGPRRKRLLLRTFGSVEGIRRASVDEIASVPTMTKTLAEKVREYLVEV